MEIVKSKFGGKTVRGEMCGEEEKLFFGLVGQFPLFLSLGVIWNVKSDVMLQLSMYLLGEGNLIFCFMSSHKNYFGLIRQQNNNPKFQNRHI